MRVDSRGEASRVSQVNSQVGPGCSSSCKTTTPFVLNCDCEPTGGSPLPVHGVDSGNRTYRVCRACPRLIEISLKSGDPVGKREDRQFCSVACKMRDLRRRKPRGETACRARVFGEGDRRKGRPRSPSRSGLDWASHALPTCGVWWYKFKFGGQPVRESARTASKDVARRAELKRRREIEEGFHGLRKREHPTSLSVAAERWLDLKRAVLSPRASSANARTSDT